MVTPRDLIGTWDGVTPSAKLERPYEDRTQMEVSFGAGSFYKSGWRAYMDTQLGSYFTNGIGVGFNSIYDPEVEAVAKVLADAGIKRTRFEIGWGYLQYDDETKIGVNAQKQAEIIKTLVMFKKYGLRPLILLNSHHGGPCPMKTITSTLLSPTQIGDRQIRLDPKNISEIKVGYTGLTGISDMNAFPLITELNPVTGVATLSAPLMKALKAGSINLTKLKYRPFSPRTFADGTINPSSDETLQGWAKYVKNVCSFAKSILGNNMDDGFDVEVWNELSFGSGFLNINNYYNPDLQFSGDYSFTTKSGQVAKGYESLLALAADIIKDSSNGFRGIKVINGFSNQTPWANNRWIYPGQDGNSRHYYTGYNYATITNGGTSWKYAPNVRVDAEGNTGSTFVPYFTPAFPEYNHTYLVTESITNDIVPFPSRFKDHHRYSNFDGKYTELWQSENNFVTSEYTNLIAAQKGIPTTSPILGKWRHYIAAKSILRACLFQNHKGLNVNIIYNAKETDVTFAVIPTDFFTALKSNKYVLNDAVLALTGPQLQAVKNTVRMFKDSVNIESPRKLKVTELIEYKPRLVFQGDGTTKHPNVYHRDNFVLLPYQINESKFVIPYYVMTQDMTFQWDKTKDIADPTAYDMPPQIYDITIANINSVNPVLSGYDPIKNINIPVTVIGSGPGSLKIRLEATDYPRFLIIEETSPGPQISGFTLRKTPAGGNISFVPNFTGDMQIRWGRYPIRRASKFKREFWDRDVKWDNIPPVAVDYIDTIDFFDRGGLHPMSPKSAVRITGKIKPKYTEVYSFEMNSNTNRVNLWIGTTQLFTTGSYDWNQTILLQAGTEYDLRFECTSPYAGTDAVTLFWYSANQEKEPVCSSESETENIANLSVTNNQAVSYDIPGLRDGDGVQLSFTNGLVSNKFPQWNYDFKGVLPPIYMDHTNG